MSRRVMCLLQMIGFAVVLAASAAWAQEPPPTRIRGTIERIDGAIYVVRNRDGAELKLTVADEPSIAGLIKASLADIKQPDGTLQRGAWREGRDGVSPPM